jgi:hypothetical protein
MLMHQPAMRGELVAIWRFRWEFHIGRRWTSRAPIVML